MGKKLGDDASMIIHATQAGGRYTRNPLGFLITLLLIVFSSETAVMFVLPVLFPAGLGETMEAVLDASLLTLLISPAVWLLLVRPLRTDAHCLAVVNEKLNGEIAVRARLEAQLKRQALHDPLTGLPNRALFVKQLRRRLMRRQRDLTRRFAVLFIDLDHFKPINDTLGHAVGDLLLAEVARRLESVVRPDDLVARMGGDEFTVLLDNVDQADEAAKIVQRILDQLSAPFSLQEPDPGGAVKWHEAQISASIGVATPSSQHETADELLRAADAAMYRAKARGRNCFEISEVACNSASAR